MRTPSQDKYDAENMAYQTVKVRKTLLESFKAACDAHGDRVNTVLRKAMEDYVLQKLREQQGLKEQPKPKQRHPRTEEQRAYANAYLRKYRREHPDKVKKWRDDYIIRKAEKLASTKGE